jgi:maleylpyruvate isomerase
MQYLDVVAAVRESHLRVEASIAALSDAQAREASLLPGWSRGHLVTHLARNADALNRLALGVLSGNPGEMYPGGPDARNAAIDEGAGRPVHLLAADFQFAGSRVIDSMQRIEPELFDTALNWRRPVSARELPALRWRELEIHHLDLDVGYTVHDWPSNFVESTLLTQIPALAEAAPEVQIPELPQPELLAWLIGRPTRTGLPALPPWPF